MRSKEEPDFCNGEIDFICGTHFNEHGELNEEGATEDFNHIDSDGSGFLRSVCVCACFEV